MLRDFEKNGYAVVKNMFDPGDDLGSFYKSIERLAHYIKPEFSPFGSFEKEVLTDKQKSNFYRALRYLPSINRLASSEKSLQLCTDLGMEFPVVMNSSNIRMDAPDGGKFLFHWHQDLTYLLGSLNSVTFWIPLTEVNRHNGSIEVIPGSHKQGFFPVEYRSQKLLQKNTVMSPSDIFLVEEPKEPGLAIEANPGDVVVFSQMLLHRSIPNFSDTVRWAIQIRYSDVMDQAFYESDYPFGDVTNIFHAKYNLESKPKLVAV